jgi:hypothetical protein
MGWKELILQIRGLGSLSSPFLAIGVAFVAIGLLLNDDRQVHFGLVWMLIAAWAVLIRKRRLGEGSRSERQ